MPLEINGQIYYKTSETYKKAGVSRSTLFRWIKAGILDKYYKDRRGWRLFTEEDINKIHATATKIEIADSFSGGTNGKKRHNYK